MNEKRITYIIAGIIFIILLIIGIMNQIKRDKALTDTVLEIATITDMYNTRGPTTVEVQFDYNGKLVKSAFSTYNWKGLHINDKVKILVSKQYPDTYIKYVGIPK